MREKSKIFSGEIILCDKCINFSEAGTFSSHLFKIKWIKHILLQKSAKTWWMFEFSAT